MTLPWCLTAKVQLRVAWMCLLGICASTLAYPVLSVWMFVDRHRPATAWYIQLFTSHPQPYQPRLMSPTFDWLDLAFVCAALFIGAAPRLIHRWIEQRSGGLPARVAHALWAAHLAFVALLALPYIRASDQATHQIFYIGPPDDYSALEAVVYIGMLVAAVACHAPPRARGAASR